MNNMSTFIQGLREQIGGHSSYPLACGPAELGIVMSKGHGFKGGEPVLRKGVIIGHVTQVSLEKGNPTLITQIERDAFKELKSGLVVEIETPTLGMGSRQVVVTSVGAGSTLSSGARVAGKTSAEKLIKSAGSLANKAMKAARNAADDLQKKADELAQPGSAPTQ